MCHCLNTVFQLCMSERLTASTAGSWLICWILHVKSVPFRLFSCSKATDKTISGMMIEICLHSAHRFIMATFRFWRNHLGGGGGGGGELAYISYIGTFRQPGYPFQGPVLVLCFSLLCGAVAMEGLPRLMSTVFSVIITIGEVAIQFVTQTPGLQNQGALLVEGVMKVLLGGVQCKRYLQSSPDYLKHFLTCFSKSWQIN